MTTEIKGSVYKELKPNSQTAEQHPPAVQKLCKQSKFLCLKLPNLLLADSCTPVPLCLKSSTSLRKEKEQKTQFNPRTLETKE